MSEWAILYLKRLGVRQIDLLITLVKRAGNLDNCTNTNIKCVNMPIVWEDPALN